MATNEERLYEAVRQLAVISVAGDTMPAILQRIAVLGNETLAASMAGLCMAVHGHLATPVFTDDTAPEIDSTQYETGIGPCLDAFRDGVVNRIPDTATDTRWAPFSATCLTHGIRSTLSLPVVADGEILGALNFYARQEAAFDEDAEVIGTAFATQAGIVMLNSRSYWDAVALNEQLTGALASRVAIEQAKGLLMAGGATSAEAFDMLRKASQRENRKLHDVAADLVAEAERRARSGGRQPT